MRRSSIWSSTTGPATCVSSSTRSAGSWRSPTPTAPLRRRCSRRKSRHRAGRSASRQGDEPEISVRLDQPLNDAIEMIEQMMVRRALERAHGNYENAAKLLGISRKGLFLKRRRWGMKRAS